MPSDKVRVQGDTCQHYILTRRGFRMPKYCASRIGGEPRSGVNLVDWLLERRRSIARRQRLFDYMARYTSQWPRRVQRVLDKLT